MRTFAMTVIFVAGLTSQLCGQEAAQFGSLPATPESRDARLAELEATANRLAAEMRRTQANADETFPEQRSQLLQTLNEAFEARHEIQANRVAELRGRLQQAESQLAERKANQEAIVSRRLAELIDDPASRWEPTDEARVDEQFVFIPRVSGEVVNWIRLEDQDRTAGAANRPAAHENPAAEYQLLRKNFSVSLPATIAQLPSEQMRRILDTELALAAAESEVGAIEGAADHELPPDLKRHVAMLRVQLKLLESELNLQRDQAIIEFERAREKRGVRAKEYEEMKSLNERVPHTVSRQQILQAEGAVRDADFEMQSHAKVVEMFDNVLKERSTKTENRGSADRQIIP